MPEELYHRGGMPIGLGIALLRQLLESPVTPESPLLRCPLGTLSELRIQALSVQLVAAVLNYKACNWQWCAGRMCWQLEIEVTRGFCVTLRGGVVRCLLTRCQQEVDPTVLL